MPQDRPGWTLPTLYTHLDGKIDDLDKRTKLQFEATKESVAIAQSATRDASTKADSALEKRLEGLNELRDIVTSLMAERMSKEAAETRFAAQDEKIVRLEKQMAEEMGAKGQLQQNKQYSMWIFAIVVSVIFSLLGLIAAVVGLWHK